MGRWQLDQGGDSPASDGTDVRTKTFRRVSQRAPSGTAGNPRVTRDSLKCRFAWCISGNQWRYGPESRLLTSLGPSCFGRSAPMRQVRRAGRATVVAALVGMCVLAGCSSSHVADSCSRVHPRPRRRRRHDFVRPPSHHRPRRRCSRRTAPRGPRSSRRTGDANPSDPALAATMVDSATSGREGEPVRRPAAGDRRAGHVHPAPEDHALSANDGDGGRLRVQHGRAGLRATGKPVPPMTPPENDGVQATLVLTGGTWKVYKQTVTDGKCAPGA